VELSGVLKISLRFSAGALAGLGLGENQKTLDIQKEWWKCALRPIAFWEGESVKSQFFGLAGYWGFGHHFVLTHGFEKIIRRS